MMNLRISSRRSLVAATSVVALSLGLIGVGAAPALAVAQPTIVRYYNNYNTCVADEEYLVETHHRIYQGCTADVYQNGKPVRWRLMAFPANQ